MPTSPPDRVHSIDVVVGRDDIDGLGHANNTAYVAWCERVAWSHSATVGLDLARYQELGRAMAIRRSTFEYLAPAFEGDRLRATTRLVGCNRLTATRRFEIARRIDDAVLLHATIDYVCVDLERFRPRRMPREFFDRYGALVVS